jgi:hypothetical protein
MVEKPPELRYVPGKWLVHCWESISCGRPALTATIPSLGTAPLIILMMPGIPIGARSQSFLISSSHCFLSSLNLLNQADLR